MTLALKLADARYDGFDEGFAEGREQGLQVGLQQGLEQGAHQKALETAKSFLAEGLPPEIVARCTGLPLETIHQLVQEY